MMSSVRLARLITSRPVSLEILLYNKSAGSASPFRPGPIETIDCSQLEGLIAINHIIVATCYPQFPTLMPIQTMPIR